MAKSAHYRVQLRRRRQGKTDYQARKAMVISGIPRLVVRPSLKNITAQIIVAKPLGDQVVSAANSRELIKKYGWKAATGNVPAAYLTGLLCGLKAKTAGVEKAILDIGMVIPTKGNKIFAVLNGVLDAGVEVPHGEEKIVTERNHGEHIATYAEELGTGSEEYRSRFSKFIAANITPENLPEHYSTVKSSIATAFKGITIAPEPQKPAKKPTPTKTAPAKEKAPVVKEKTPTIKTPEAPLPVKEKQPVPTPKEEAPKPKIEEKAPEVKVQPEKPAEAKEPAKKPVKAHKAAKAAKATPKTKAAKEPKAEPVEAAEEEAKPKAAPKKKAAAKEKTPKAKAPKKEKTTAAKEKAPAKKAAKKGENKE